MEETMKSISGSKFKGTIVTLCHFTKHGVYITTLLENITHNGLVYANTITLGININLAHVT